MEQVATSPANETIAVHSGEFPQLQARYRRQWRIWAAVCAGGTLLGTVVGGSVWGWGLLVASVVLLAIVSIQLSRQLSQYYKGEIVPQLVRHFCDEGEYDANDGIDEEVFIESNLFPTRPDRYTTEDLIEGRIGKTEFRFAEVKAMEERTVHTSRGTRTTWVKIFRGFFFVADFNKDFAGQTTLVPNFWGAKWLAGKQRVTLENPELMRRFLVCSTDQIEARYILTPGLMERIMKLAKRYPRCLRISFTGSCIMVARDCSRNHYEAGLWRPMSECIRRDILAVRELTGLVEELNMNTRIWTKE